ncbi:hypothetical protein E2C01_039104 [Portunus trituberculatus]|uniref:Uncharacterized protein n=1 Tax=Portunus trituberculatus TaxID=210409 RepID=A0A5B7FIZ2_PORTR|nr:hypothetical protein [Portunus trituberculatus]
MQVSDGRMRLGVVVVVVVVVVEAMERLELPASFKQSDVDTRHTNEGLPSVSSRLTANQRMTQVRVKEAGVRRWQGWGMASSRGGQEREVCFAMSGGSVFHIY